MPDIVRSLNRISYCDDSIRVSNISIDVRGRPNEVSGLKVTFRCGDLPKCNLGNTNILGIFEGRLPPCKGGEIKITGKGFEPQKLVLDTHRQGTITKTILASPLKEFEVTILKIPLDEYLVMYYETGKLDPRDQAKKLDDDIVLMNIDDGWPGFFPPEDMVELSPGEHTLDVQLLREVTIQEGEALNRSMQGILPGSHNTLHSEFTEQDIRIGSEIVFYLFTEPESIGEVSDHTTTLLQQNGDIRAMLIFQDPILRYEETGPVCGTGGSLVSITTNEDNLEPCQRAEEITITYEDYAEYIQPIIR
jgi:hypothetical protein